MKNLLKFMLLIIIMTPVVSFAQVYSTTSKVITPTPVLKKDYSSLNKQSPSKSVLKLGDVGGQVSNLQALLFNHGFKITTIDGKFGKETEKAVKEFQALAGLKIDGKFGAAGATYMSLLPAGSSIKKLDKNTIDALKTKYVSTVTGKNISGTSNASVSSMVRSVIAKLPKGVTLDKSVSNLLPTNPNVLNRVTVAASKNNTPAVVRKLLSSKPKLVSVLKSAQFSVVTSAGTKDRLVGPETNTNYSNNSNANATKEYICATLEGEDTCAAVSVATAAKVRSGELDAREVLAALLGSSSVGECSYFSRGLDGNLVMSNEDNCTPDSNQGGSAADSRAATTCTVTRGSSGTRSYQGIVNADKYFKAFVWNKNTKVMSGVIMQDMGGFGKAPIIPLSEQVGSDIPEVGSFNLGPGDQIVIAQLIDPSLSRNAVMGQFSFESAGKKVFYTNSGNWQVALSKMDAPDSLADFTASFIQNELSNNPTWTNPYELSDNNTEPFSSGIDGKSSWISAFPNGDAGNSQKIAIFITKESGVDAAPMCGPLVGRGCTFPYEGTGSVINNAVDCKQPTAPLRPEDIGTHVCGPSNLNNVEVSCTGTYPNLTIESTVTFAPGAAAIVPVSPPGVELGLSGVPEIKLKAVNTYGTKIKFMWSGIATSPLTKINGATLIPLSVGSSYGFPGGFYRNGLTAFPLNNQAFPAIAAIAAKVECTPPAPIPMCVEHNAQQLGITNYRLTYTNPVEVSAVNNSDIKIKITKPNGTVLYAIYTGSSDDGVLLNFMLAPGTSFTPSVSDYVGVVDLVLTNGATIKNPDGTPVPTHIGTLVATDACESVPPYQGLPAVESVTPVVTEVAPTGGYNNGPQKKLRIEVRYQNSSTGSSNVVVFGNPSVCLQKNETTDLGACAAYTSGSGTDTIVFEHTSNAQNYPNEKYDSTTYNHFKLNLNNNDAFRTLAPNGTSMYPVNNFWFDSH